MELTTEQLATQSLGQLKEPLEHCAAHHQQVISKAFDALRKKYEAGLQPFKAYEYVRLGSGGIWAADNRITWSQFNIGSKAVLTLNANGEIETFDLPFLIWVWLRKTWPFRFAKAFWYGWAA